MNPSSAAFTFGILTTSLLAQGAQPPTVTPPLDFPTFVEPELFVAVEPGLVRFTVASEYTPFLGIVLISGLPNLAQVASLPPLLEQSMILTYGYTEQPRFSAAIQESVFPPGVTWHVQGVAWSDFGGIRASEVESFVLDASAPQQPGTGVDAVPTSLTAVDATPTPASESETTELPAATKQSPSAQESDAARPSTTTTEPTEVPAATKQSPSAQKNDTARPSTQVGG